MLLNFFKRDAGRGGKQNKSSQKPPEVRGKRFFDAAKQDAHTTAWPSMPVHIDSIIEAYQRTIVARSREQYANNDYVKNYIRMIKRNVVGPKGIIFQAKVKNQKGMLENDINDAIEKAWKTWGAPDNCEVTGRLCFRDVENLFISTVARDGEGLIRLVYGKDAGPWGFALQVLDPQRIPIYLKVEELPNGGFIRNGIEFNQFGRPVAYYFTSKDTPERAYWGAGGPDNFTRVPADQIIHGFITEFVSQKRGIPWGVSALWRLRKINKFEQASVNNAQIGAAKLGFFTREYEDPNEMVDQAAGLEGVEGGEGCAEDQDDEQKYVIDAEPGTWEALPPGWKPQSWDPAYPNGEFDAFNKAMLRGASAGLGVSYHSLANDLTDVNFSSIRQGALDERDEWASLQQWLIDALHAKIYRAWLKYSLLAGKIKLNGKPLSMARFDDFQEVIWQPRRWAWIDPLKDVNANIETMSNLLRSPSDIIREQGRDPEEVWKEFSEDITSMKNSGLPDEVIQRFISGSIAKIKGKPPGGSTEETEPRD